MLEGGKRKIQTPIARLRKYSLRECVNVNGVQEKAVLVADLNPQI